jgi:membrane protease subunit HflK
MSERPAGPQPRRRRRGRGLFALFLLAVFTGAWTALYGVVELSGDEVALVSRAGRVVRQIEGPGRHFHLPFPVERRAIVSLAPREIPAASVTVVTRDAQVLEVSYRGKFRVEHARAARFALRSPTETVVAAIVGALAEVAARQDYDGVRAMEPTATGRVQREADARLTHAVAGLRVVTLDLAFGGAAAIAALDAEIETLRSARDEAARAAREEGEALLGAARLMALEVSTQARLERDALLSKASGEAERFRALAAEYRRSPEVVRTRIYLETMEEILGNARLVIADPGAPLPPVSRMPEPVIAAPEVSAGPGQTAAGVAP